MEFDTKLLHDLLDFLRRLEDVPLPPMFATLRATLLGRMQAAISAGDNYIDMKPGKQLQDVNTAANDSAEEYVTTDQQLPSSPGSFLYPNPNKQTTCVIKAKRATPTESPKSDNNSQPQSQVVVTSQPASRSSPPRVTQPAVIPVDEEDGAKNVEQEEIVDPFIEIYSYMNLLQAEAKSHFFGELQKKEKRFFFESMRSFWAVLVGSHFLSYDSRADQKPSQILPIKGCVCKAVASPQRNGKRSESTFEICFEDDKCFQFTASTAKEMEQWLAAIRRCEAKSRETINHVTQIQIDLAKAATSIPEAEETSRVSNSSEVYEDIVIPDIALALANPAKYPNKANTSRSTKPAATINQVKVVKNDSQKTPNNVLPLAPKLIKRDLPPPPPPSENDEEEMMYHIIDEPKTCRSGEVMQRNSTISKKDFQESTEELYDDILMVKKEVEKLVMDKKVNAETAKNIVTEEPRVEDNEETYDDIDVVKKEVEVIRKSESVTKESKLQTEKEKTISKESPRIPTRNSPVKCFFDRFRHKSESPHKEDAKRKPPMPSPQNSPKMTTSVEIKTDQSSPAMKNNDEYANDHAIDELSNYNSPPPPRPIRNDNSARNTIVADEEEIIYDDVAANRNAAPENELEKRKRADELASKLDVFAGKSDGPSPGVVRSQRNVSRNLSEQFDDEIYQNQSAEEKVEEDLEHYQVPRADANLCKPPHVEDDDDPEKVYDDVEIVAKKKRENEEAKQKPAAKSPSKHKRGPPLMTKPVDNFFQQKLNKFSLLVAEKSASEKKFQHRFGVGKKSKVQEVIMRAEKQQINSTDTGDNDIYDDCQAVKG